MNTITGRSAFLALLKDEGITHLFGNPGTTELPIMDALSEHPDMGYVLCLQESLVVAMADGYSRVSGRQGVCTGQNGPGISNCVTGIAAAFWAHSPVVIVTPETGTMGIGLGGFQECNQLPMFQEFTKYQVHLNNPARMAEYTGRCFDRALSEMGPTQLNIPRDLFYGDIDVEQAVDFPYDI